MRLWRVILLACYKIKVKTCIINVHSTHRQLRERERESKSERMYKVVQKAKISK